MRLRVLLSLSFVLLAAAGAGGSARADLIVETASIGPGNAGAGIGGIRWLGTRFTLTEEYHITEIGGRLSGAQSLFAALVPLDGPMGLPPHSPNDIPSYALAFGLLNVTNAIEDYLTPVSVDLGPGDYGLVIGVGFFGGKGGGNMDTSGVQTPGASYFEAFPINLGLPEGWYDAPQAQNLRFLVYGTALRAVPEPATITSLASALVVGLAGLVCRRSGKHTPRRTTTSALV